MQLTAPRGACSRAGWTNLSRAGSLDFCGDAKKSKVGTSVNVAATDTWSIWWLRSLLNGSGREEVSAAGLEARQHGIAAQHWRQSTVEAEACPSEEVLPLIPQGSLDG